MDPLSTLSGIANLAVALAVRIEAKTAAAGEARDLLDDLRSFASIASQVGALSTEITARHPDCKGNIDGAVQRMLERSRGILINVRQALDEADASYSTVAGLTSLLYVQILLGRLQTKRDEVNTLIGLANAAYSVLRGVQSDIGHMDLVRRMQDMTAQLAEMASRPVAAVTSRGPRAHAFAIAAPEVIVTASTADAIPVKGPEAAADRGIVLPAHWRRHPAALRAAVAAVAAGPTSGVAGAISALTAAAATTPAAAATPSATATPPAAAAPNVLVKYIALNTSPAFLQWMEELQGSGDSAQWLAEDFAGRVLTSMDELQELRRDYEGGVKGGGVARTYGIINQSAFVFNPEAAAPPMPFIAFVMEPYPTDVATLLGITPHGVAVGATPAAGAADSVPLARRLGFLTQTATTMSRLHTAARPITHGDLRTPHLLLQADGVHVALTGFGVARLFDPVPAAIAADDGDGAGGAGAGASAVAGADAETSKAADVRALGIIAVEVLTGTAVSRHLTLEAALAMLPAGLPAPVYEVVRACWAASPSHAISMNEVAVKLRQAAALAPAPSRSAGAAAGASTARPVLSIGGLDSDVSGGDGLAIEPDAAFWVALQRFPWSEAAAGAGARPQPPLYGAPFVAAAAAALAKALAPLAPPSPSPGTVTAPAARFTSAQLRIALGGQQPLLDALARALRAAILYADSATPAASGAASSPLTSSLGSGGNGGSSTILRLPRGDGGSGTVQARLVRVDAGAGSGPDDEAVFSVADATLGNHVIAPSWLPACNAHLLGLYLTFGPLLAADEAVAEPRLLAITVPQDREKLKEAEALTRRVFGGGIVLHARDDAGARSDDAAPSAAAAAAAVIVPRTVQLLQITALNDVSKLGPMALLDASQVTSADRSDMPAMAMATATVGGGFGTPSISLASQPSLVLRNTSGITEAELLLLAADVLGGNGTARRSFALGGSSDGSSGGGGGGSGGGGYSNVLQWRLLTLLPTPMLLPLARNAAVPIAALRALLVSSRDGRPVLLRGTGFVAVLDAVSSFRASRNAALWRRAATALAAGIDATARPVAAAAVSAAAGGGGDGDDGRADAVVARRWWLALRVQPLRECPLPSTVAVAQAVQAALADAASRLVPWSSSTAGVAVADWPAPVAVAYMSPVELCVPAMNVSAEQAGAIFAAASSGTVLRTGDGSAAVRVLTASWVAPATGGGRHPDRRAVALAQARSAFEAPLGASPLTSRIASDRDAELRVVVDWLKGPLELSKNAAVGRVLATHFGGGFRDTAARFLPPQEPPPPLRMRISVSALTTRLASRWAGKPVLAGDPLSAAVFAAQALVGDRRIIRLPSSAGAVGALRASCLTAFGGSSQPALLVEPYDIDGRRRIAADADLSAWMSAGDAGGWLPPPAVAEACLSALVAELAAVPQPLAASQLDADLPAIVLPLPPSVDPDAAAALCQARTRLPVALAGGAMAEVEMRRLLRLDLDGDAGGLMLRDPLAPDAAPHGGDAAPDSAAVPAAAAAAALPPAPTASGTESQAGTSDAAGGAPSDALVHRRGISTGSDGLSPRVEDNLSPLLLSHSKDSLRWHTGNLYDNSRTLHRVDGRDPHRAAWLMQVPKALFARRDLQALAVSATRCPLPAEDELAWEPVIADPGGVRAYPDLGILELRFKTVSDKEGFAKTVAAVCLLPSEKDVFGQAIWCEVNLQPRFALTIMPAVMGARLRAPESTEEWYRWANERWTDVDVRGSLSRWMHRFGCHIFVVDGVEAASKIAAVKASTGAGVGLTWIDGQAVVVRPYVPPVFATNLWPHLLNDPVAIAAAAETLVGIDPGAGAGAGAGARPLGAVAVAVTHVVPLIADAAAAIFIASPRDRRRLLDAGFIHVPSPASTIVGAPETLPLTGSDKTEQHATVAVYLAGHAPQPAGISARHLTVRIVPSMRFAAIIWPLPTTIDDARVIEQTGGACVPFDNTELPEGGAPIPHLLDITAMTYMRAVCCGMQRQTDGRCATVDFATAEQRDGICAMPSLLDRDNPYIRAHPTAALVSTLFDREWCDVLVHAADGYAGRLAHVNKLLTTRLGMAALAQQRWNASHFIDRWQECRNAAAASLLRRIARLSTRAALEAHSTTHRQPAGGGAGAGAGAAAAPSSAYHRLVYWDDEGRLHRAPFAPRLALDITARTAAPHLAPADGGAAAAAAVAAEPLHVHPSDDVLRLAEGMRTNILTGVTTDGGIRGEYWGDDVIPGAADVTFDATIRTDVMAAFAPHFALAAAGASPTKEAAWGGVASTPIRDPTVVRNVAVFRDIAANGFAFWPLDRGFEADLLVLPPPPSDAAAGGASLVAYYRAALGAAARAGARELLLPPVGWVPAPPSNWIGNAAAVATAIGAALAAEHVAVTLHLVVPSTASSEVVALFASLAGRVRPAA